MTVNLSFTNSHLSVSWHFLSANSADHPLFNIHDPPLLAPSSRYNDSNKADANTVRSQLHNQQFVSYSITSAKEVVFPSVYVFVFLFFSR